MTIKKRINLLNGIGYALVVLQVLSFLGNLGKPVQITDPAERIGYYIGLHFFLYIAIALFLKARALRKKYKKNNLSNLVELIGKPE